MMRMPTHWMLTATTTASMAANAASMRTTEMPRLWASDGLTESRSRWLKRTAQTSTTRRSTASSPARSDGVMLRMSPIRSGENFEKPPPRLMTMRPTAMAVEENTPMTVSADAAVRCLM